MDGENGGSMVELHTVSKYNTCIVHWDHDVLGDKIFDEHFLPVENYNG